MRTEHGRTFSKWNELGRDRLRAGAQRSDPVPGQGIEVNEWRLKYEAQMKDYQGEITVYPDFDHLFGIPYGDWISGPGHWWVRAVDVDVDVLGDIGDVFLGNNGGGPNIPFTNVMTNMPALFNWTYP